MSIATRCVALALAVLIAMSAVSAQNYTHVTWTRVLANPSPFRKEHMGAFRDTGFTLYGGLDGALFSTTERSTYDFDQNEFEDNVTTAATGRRAAGAVHWKDMIVAYGGFVGGSRSSSTMFFDMNTLDVETRSGSSSDWTVVNPSSLLVHTASPCTDPTAVLDDEESMWVFGGLTSVTMLNHITQFYLPNSTVYAINDNTANRPTRRYATAGAFIRIGGIGYVFMFGGLRQKDPNETPTTLGDEMLFRISDKDWVTPTSVMGTRTTLPPGRAYATMVTVPDNAGMILYGGDLRNSTSEVHPYDDAYYFKADSGTGQFTWTPVTINSGTVPTARSQHVAFMGVQNGEISMVVHGGRSDTGATLNDVHVMTFDPCPLGKGNCFTNDPYRNNTNSAAAASSSTTGGNSENDGGGSGDSGTPEQFSTGLVNVAPAASLRASLLAWL